MIAAMRSLSGRSLAGLSNRGLWLLAVTCALLCGCKEGDVDFGDGGLFDDAGSAADGGAPDGGGRDAGDPDAGDPDDDAGSEPSADGGTRPEPSPDEWPMHLAAALCDALEDCYGSADLLRDALNGRDCTALNVNTLQSGDLRYLSDSAAAGRVLWSPDELDACLQSVRGLGCEARSTRLPASCELLIAGTVSLGSECALDEECAGDAYCDRFTELTCPGTCSELVTEDGSCTNDDDDQCADGLVCFNGTETCVPLAELGDDCGSGLPGCKPGLVCNGPAASATCAALATVYFRELGESCEPGGDLCEAGLVCESLTGESGMCAEQVGAGEACRRASPNQCPPTQYCSATEPGETGTCTDYPADGEPCIDDGRAQTCADGTVCIEDTCRTREQPGEPCTADAQCWSGTCGNDGTCSAPPQCEL
jgi:hypothetical protein